MSITRNVTDRDARTGRIMAHLSTAAGIAEGLLRNGADGDAAETLRRVITACDDLSQLVLDTFPEALDGSADDASQPAAAPPTPAQETTQDEPLIWLNVGMTQTDWNRAMRWIGITAEDRPAEAKYANRLLNALDRAARASQDYVFPSHTTDDDDCETDCL